MSAPREIDVHANGLTFGALSWGDEDAPLALLLHGYPDTAWTWRHLGPHLAGLGWRAVAPFTRGYAPTDLAPDDRYDVRDLAQDALALHTALGGDEHAVLVGHDWGAIATWKVTATEPGRFARHVCMSVAPGPALPRMFASRASLGTGLRQARMSWYLLYNQLPMTERTLDTLIPRLWRNWSPGYDGTLDAERALAALDGPGRRRAAQQYYRHSLKRGLKDLLTTHPQAPVLYLHGEHDGCLQPQLGDLYADAYGYPEGTVVERVPGVGHFLQLEDPERVNALISSYLGAPGTARAA